MTKWINIGSNMIWHIQKDNGSPMANLMRLMTENNPSKEAIEAKRKRFDKLKKKKK